MDYETIITKDAQKAMDLIGSDKIPWNPYVETAWYFWGKKGTDNHARREIHVARLHKDAMIEI